MERYVINNFGRNYIIYDRLKKVTVGNDEKDKFKVRERVRELNEVWDNVHKVVVKYNDVLFSFKDVEDAAVNLFKFKVEKSEEGDWDVWVNGNKVCSYVSYESDEDNGWTYDEVRRDYLKEFTKKNTYANLKWYEIMV